MSKKTSSKLHELVDTIEKEVIPSAKEGCDELSKAAKDLVPHVRGGWEKFVDYCKGLKCWIKGEKKSQGCCHGKSPCKTQKHEKKED